MTTPDAMPDASSEVKDFTLPRTPHRFRIDPDEFAAPPLIGGTTLRKIGTLYGSMANLDTSTPEGIEGSIVAVSEMMKVLLPGHHGRRFAERLLSDGDPGDPGADPPVPPSPPVIDLQREALPVVYWLIERYGLGRPTQPSSDLPAGSTENTTGGPNAGISSTAGASPEASTS